MNYRTNALERQRAAHIAECKARRAPPCHLRAESLAEYVQRGGRIERLPQNAVSKVNELKGRYA
jgi:hypothetical protein